MNHQKTAEHLVGMLDRINEAVELAAGSVALFIIAAMRTRFVDLYAHVFLFFIEAIERYSAPSRSEIAPLRLRHDLQTETRLIPARQSR